MKTNLVKKVAAMFAFVAAIGGAFAFKAVEAKTVAPHIGYTDWNSPCQASVSCDTFDNDILCTAIVGGQPRQAKGKTTPQATSCTLTLYMPEQP
jgi:hypothetical protein